MKITKHAQSCLLVETEDTKILIDPGVFVTEKEGYDLNKFVNIDAILISHEHSDHFEPEDIKKIINNNPDIPVYTTEKVKSLFDYKNVSVLKSQQVITLNEFYITGVKSIHGPLPNGMEPPEVIGFLIDDGKNTFYDPADTIKLFAKAEIIAEPICGHVVMDIERAKEEALRIKPREVFPIHYDNPTFPVDVNDFAEAMKDTGIDVRVLKDGEVIEV